MLCYRSIDSRQVFNAKTQVMSQAVPREICVGQVALGQAFIRVFRLSLSISFHQRSVLIFTHMLLLPEEQKWNNQFLLQRNSLSKTGEPLILSLVFQSSKGRWYFIVLILIITRNNKTIKVKWLRYRPGVAQRVGRGIALLFHDCGTRRRWVVSSTPRPHFTPRKDPVPIL